MRPEIQAFFDEITNTASYVVADPSSRECAIVDSVLDYDPASGRTRNTAADAIVAFVQAQGFRTRWILETHVHADHLSAGSYLKQRLGGQLGIGAAISMVQDAFGRIFNDMPDPAGGGAFDHLFQDGETFALGRLRAEAIATPGHTPACMTYRIGDAAFVGDTLFMPDSGTARCDFPGGDARQFYASIRKILSWPPETRLFLCHDYKTPGRNSYCWQTTVAAQRAGNIHIRDGVSEEAFVAMRNARDATLDMPRLMLPAVQVNMRAGCLPPAEANGIRYLKIPLDVL